MPKLATTPNRPRAVGYDDIARRRIKQWILSTPDLSQAKFGASCGKNQAWISRYLAGEFIPDIDTLDQMARYFGHSLFSLLDLAETDDGEARIVEAYRRLSPRSRKTALQLLEDWAEKR